MPDANDAGENLLTVDQVAAILQVSRAWVQDHATRKQPRLPAIKIGRLNRFRREDIKRFIERHARQAA